MHLKCGTVEDVEAMGVEFEVDCQDGPDRRFLAQAYEVPGRYHVAPGRVWRAGSLSTATSDRILRDHGFLGEIALRSAGIAAGRESATASGIAARTAKLATAS